MCLKEAQRDQRIVKGNFNLSCYTCDVYKRSFGIRCSVSSEIRVQILIYCKILACDIKIVVLRRYGRIMQ